MFETERLEKIQEILAENGARSVQRLARALFVSESTVRRDLSELQRQGLVKRIHGGAVLITGASRELPLYMRGSGTIPTPRSALRSRRFPTSGTARCCFWTPPPRCRKW